MKTFDEAANEVKEATRSISTWMEFLDKKNIREYRDMPIVQEFAKTVSDNSLNNFLIKYPEAVVHLSPLYMGYFRGFTILDMTTCIAVGIAIGIEMEKEELV